MIMSGKSKRVERERVDWPVKERLWEYMDEVSSLFRIQMMATVHFFKCFRIVF